MPLEQSALALFEKEFTLVPADPRLSRGFLNGMQFLLARVEPNSTLAWPARKLVLACEGNRTGRQDLVVQTEEQHVHLLQIYGSSLAAKSNCISVENLYTAVLLGLYEVRT